MTPGELTRLTGALNLLASNHPGEVQAAAAAAARIIQRAGVSWGELLGLAGSQARAEPPSSPGRGDLWECARSMHLLSDWEQDFITSVSQQRTLSEKQQAVIARIAARVRTAA